METWKLIHDFDKAAILKLPRTNTVKLVISLGRLFGSKAIQCCSCIYLFVFVQFIPIMYSEGHFRKKKEILYKIQQSKLLFGYISKHCFNTSCPLMNTTLLHWVSTFFESFWPYATLQHLGFKSDPLPFAMCLPLLSPLSCLFSLLSLSSTGKTARISGLNWW